MENSQPVDIPCPRCGHRPVDCLAPGEGGAYCRCDACGHMWHQDGLEVKRREPGTPRRRKTDHD